MAKYHYNVHVVPKTAGIDCSLWVGVVLPCKHDEGEPLEGTLLERAALARARELCPALTDCFCEEWNGGEEVIDDPVYSFLGKDYKDKMGVLKAAIRPLLEALDQTHMQLVVDRRGEYWLTAIPWKDELNGEIPSDVNPGKLLDATIALGDSKHLVAVIE